MRKSIFGLIGAALLVWPLAAQTAATPKPKRINRAIEMLEQGQPIYYTGPGAGDYEAGKKMALTKADYIDYGLEHGAFDMTKLREFMRGLVDGGPTRTGHRTPTVIVNTQVTGMDEAYMRANSWVLQQIMATGVHGLLLTHVRSTDAARVMVEAVRYPFSEKVAGLNEGFRGGGSQGYASQIWGISQDEYLRKADPWPLNKQGEILLGVKIEDRYALQNAETTTKVPGIGFAEWGPGDMEWSLVGLPPARAGAGPGRGGRGGAPGPGAEGGREAFPPVMVEARARVLKATKDAHIFFLNSCNENNVVDMIKEGVMICTSGDSPTSAKGREFSKRPQPWP